MRSLSLDEIVELHRRVIEQSGGSYGIRDKSALQSCLAQPHQSFGDEELYPSIPDKAAALGFFLVRNHPFVDGNKRIGHAALEVTLVLNGLELSADVDEQATHIRPRNRNDLARRVHELGHPTLETARLICTTRGVYAGN